MKNSKGLHDKITSIKSPHLLEISPLYFVGILGETCIYKERKDTIHKKGTLNL